MDALLTDEIRARPPEAQRRSRMGVSAAVLVGLLGIFAASIHLALGNPMRALVPASAIPISALLLWRVRRSTSNTANAHILCAFGSGILIGSPLLGDSETPILVGLILLPYAAATLGGARTGLIWTCLTTTFLLLWTPLVQYQGEERNLAWLIIVSTAALGFGASYAERSRERSEERMATALEDIRRHADERGRAEKQLNRTRALFESTFDNAPSILVIASLADGKILDVNDSFTKITGWSIEEVRGKTLDELNLWETEEERIRLARNAASPEGIDSLEVQMRTKSGKLVWLLAIAKTLHVAGEGYLLAQGLEVTERKRNERELALYREQLEAGFERRGEKLREQEKLSSIGTLASGIAHQINNPVGAIVAAAQFALATGDDSDRDEIRERALQRIDEEAMRCGRIVSNMLKFARNEPTAKWKNDFNLLVRGAIEATRNYVDERGGRLDVQLTTESLQIHSSPIDLEQVVVNLVRNAAESRPAGAVVRVRTMRVGDQGILSVADDGEGFSEENRIRAFDPFYSSRIHDGGSGLGLSIVHGIVKDHGGQIDIRDSDLGARSACRAEAGRRRLARSP